jgi:ubiquinone/menaquinone biosynthesis C-methylase UbiE
MLNPTFSTFHQNQITEDYIAPIDIAESTLSANSNFETGIEYRLQSVYGDEIWLKLERAGFTEDRFNKSSILEVCAGNGFLTYHLLTKIRPIRYVINDISEIELEQNQKLITENFSNPCIEYLHGDVHTLDVSGKFDIVIGNSFLHHFHDVSMAFKSIMSYLKPGGIFISLHEPTPLSPIVEGAKIFALPIGIMFPTFINNFIRMRYDGPPSETDLWMFEEKKLKKLFSKLNVLNSKFYYWNLFRPIVVHKKYLHLSKNKQSLNTIEEKKFKNSILKDSLLNKFLPSRFFGSMCIVLEK